MLESCLTPAESRLAFHIKIISDLLRMGIGDLLKEATTAEKWLASYVTILSDLLSMRNY
jgi:hypothetical protein